MKYLIRPQQLAAALALGLLSSCSLTPESAAPKTVVQSADNVPCETCPPTDPQPNDPEPCVEPSQTIKDKIKAYVAKELRLRSWQRVTTHVPPDGITYGLGCNGPYGVYLFSVDITDEYGRDRYASGTYDAGTGQFTLN